jgi:hypothetical protein
MSVDDVERLLGSARSTTANGPVETRSYAEYDVDLVNGIAVDTRRRAAGGGAGGAVIRKGMTPAEVEALAGKPIETRTNGQLVTHKYRWQGGTLEADFFNEVLVAYRMSSNE